MFTLILVGVVVSAIAIGFVGILYSIADNFTTNGKKYRVREISYTTDWGTRGLTLANIEKALAHCKISYARNSDETKPLNKTEWNEILDALRDIWKSAKSIDSDSSMFKKVENLFDGCVDAIKEAHNHIRSSETDRWSQKEYNEIMESINKMNEALKLIREDPLEKKTDRSLKELQDSLEICLEVHKDVLRIGPIKPTVEIKASKELA